MLCCHRSSAAHDVPAAEQGRVRGSNQHQGSRRQAVFPAPAPGRHCRGVPPTRGVPLLSSAFLSAMRGSCMCIRWSCEFLQPNRLVHSLAALLITMAHLFVSCGIYTILKAHSAWSRAARRRTRSWSARTARRSWTSCWACWTWTRAPAGRRARCCTALDLWTAWACLRAL